MASDKPASANNVLPANIRIKTEPGTSTTMPVTNIKTEPGQSPSTLRLTSFRLPRDLTLGGNIKTEKPKKTYVPNLNAQRNKKRDDAAPVKNEFAKSSRGRDRGRGRGRGDRGRNRLPNNLIQSAGVFSEGAMELSAAKRYSGPRDSSDRKDTQFLEKPKLNLNRTVDKAEEEEKLKLLLRDDFIDDGLNPNLDNGPVMLPMVEDVKLYKEYGEEPKSKVDIVCKEEIDKKPIILENGEVLQTKKEAKPDVPRAYKKEHEFITVPQIMENKTNSYFLIQLPDCLPGLESSGEPTDPRARRVGEAVVEKENDNKAKTEYCCLESLKSGMLGKLQILKSGKARLCLGDNKLIIDVGSTQSFRQDLIASKLDTTELTGDLINLGPVNGTLICSPDWESMLATL